MQKLLYATSALTTAALVAGVAGNAAAQTTPAVSNELAQITTDLAHITTELAQATPPAESQRRSQVPPTAPAAEPTPPPSYGRPAERIKLGLSGFHQQWGVFTPQNLKTRAAPGAPRAKQPTNDVTEKHNSEICVIGQTTLDNGLTIGVNVQFEANTSNDQVDESYLFVQSPTLGQLILGDENNAAYLLHVTAPDGGISIDEGDLISMRLFETGLTPAPNFDTPLGSTFTRFLDNDSGKFTYITPRYGGFQAGISYIPEITTGGDNNSALRRAGTGDAPFGTVGSGRASGLYNGVAPALNHTSVIGPVGVQASVGYMWAQTGSGFTAPLTGHQKDLNAYNAGAQFNVAGFSLGGAWLYAPQGTGTLGTTYCANGSNACKLNGLGWIVGAAYEFGPYKVGVDYEYGDNNPTSAGGKSRLRQGIVSGTYTLGPGIRLVGGVFYYDWEQENQLSQNHGIGGTTAIKLGF